MNSKIFSLKKNKNKKNLVFITILSLIFNISTFGIVFCSIGEVQAEDLCQVPVDVVLSIDVSASMTEGEVPSQCEWSQLEWIVSHFEWVDYIDYDVDQSYCDDKDLSPHHPSIYTDSTQNKINEAKDAAKLFVNNLGSNDQSGLVSFSDSAIVEKTLSNDHTDTDLAIDNLIIGSATNIGDAIAFSKEELDVNGNPQSAKVIILLTDGRPTKPNGDGFNENQTDVDYAIEKTNEAMGAGYKIFTIAIGEDINSILLENIADLTGGQYYHSPNSLDLEEIYMQISQSICEFGSISGCKYSDINNNGEIDQGEEPLSGWEIVIDSGVATTSQLTDVFGCYNFAGLEPGDYIISETQQIGWSQTFPQTETYEISLDWEEILTDYDFANHQSIEEFGSIAVCKYYDNGYVGLYEEGIDTQLDWEFELLDAQEVFIGSSTTSSEAACVIFSELEYGDYIIREATTTEDWINTIPVEGTGYYNVNINGENQNPSFVFLNYEDISSTCGDQVCDNDENCETCAIDCGTCGGGDTYCGDGVCNGEEDCESCDYDCGTCEQDPYCGDGICNDSEDCSSCSNDCGNCISGGGGGIFPVELQITNPQITMRCAGDSVSLIMTWLTNKPATSRVVYDTEPHPDANAIGTPNYGYAFSTDEDSTKVTGHSVEITGLLPDTVYYFRPVSSASPEELGEEKGLSQTLTCGNDTGGVTEVIVLGESGAPELSITKAFGQEFANPGDKGVFYRIAVTNNGNLDAYNVMLNDVLPNGIMFSDDYGIDKTWELGDIAPGETREINYLLDITDDASASILTSTATASATNHDVVIANADLEIRDIEVLAETGFDMSEFILLSIIIIGFTYTSRLLRRELVSA